MLSHTRRPLIIILGLCISIIFLWFALHDIRLTEVLVILSHPFDSVLIFWALFTYALFFIFKTLRWHYLISAKVKLSTGQLIPYVLLGYAGNIILPFQAGEITRGYLLSRRHPVTAVVVISTIVLEKIFDLLMVLFFLFLALLFVDYEIVVLNTIVETTAYLLASVILSLVLILLLPEHSASLIKILFAKMPHYSMLTQLKSWCIDTVESVQHLKDKLVLFKITFITLLAWLSMLISLYCSVAAFNIEISFSIAVIILFLSAVGMVLPTSPGFVGTIQIAFVVGMVPFGISQEDAVAASLVYNGLISVIPFFAGAFCFIQLRFSIKELMETGLRPTRNP